MAKGTMTRPVAARQMQSTVRSRIRRGRLATLGVVAALVAGIVIGPGGGWRAGSIALQNNLEMLREQMSENASSSQICGGTGWTQSNLRDYARAHHIDHQTNPSPPAMNAIFDQVGSQLHIPPTVLKAVAWQESETLHRWNHFEPIGSYAGLPVISGDCGIGVMQLTDKAPRPGQTTCPATELCFNLAQLMSDVTYNVMAGGRVLLYAWSHTGGRVHGSDPAVIENWYWPVYCYNGCSDPHLAHAPYADRVFGWMAGLCLYSCLLAQRGCQVVPVDVSPYLGHLSFPGWKPCDGPPPASVHREGG